MECMSANQRRRGAAFACVIGSNLSLVGSGNSSLFPLQTNIVVVARYRINAQCGSSPTCVQMARLTLAFCNSLLRELRARVLSLTYTSQCLVR